MRGFVPYQTTYTKRRRKPSECLLENRRLPPPGGRDGDSSTPFTWSMVTKKNQKPRTPEGLSRGQGQDLVRAAFVDAFGGVRDCPKNKPQVTPSDLSTSAADSPMAFNSPSRSFRSLRISRPGNKIRSDLLGLLTGCKSSLVNSRGKNAAMLGYVSRVAFNLDRLFKKRPAPARSKRRYLSTCPS